MSEHNDFVLPDGTVLAGEHRPGTRPTVVFLHAGVADRRSWTGVLDALAADDLNLVTYDRRGFGDTPPADEGASFTHLADLLAVLDSVGASRAFVVGNSMGGGLGLDLAATAPDRVAGLLLIGSAVSGMTDDDTPFDWVSDAATDAVFEALQEGEERDDAAGQVRALAHLWLDGPTADEGRVSGPARDLFAAMNARILDIAAPDKAGDAGLDTWTSLHTITAPTIVTWGALDIPADLPFYEETVRRLGQGAGRVLPDTAHLPGLEQPTVVADLVRELVRSNS